MSSSADKKKECNSLEQSRWWWIEKDKEECNSLSRTQVVTIRVFTAPIAELHVLRFQPMMAAPSCALSPQLNLPKLCANSNSQRIQVRLQTPILRQLLLRARWWWRPHNLLITIQVSIIMRSSRLQKGICRQKWNTDLRYLGRPIKQKGDNRIQAWINKTIIRARVCCNCLPKMESPWMMMK